MHSTAVVVLSLTLLHTCYEAKQHRGCQMLQLDLYRNNVNTKITHQILTNLAEEKAV